jgi:hypothetical protein
MFYIPAQILTAHAGSLACDSYDEAKTLIPSLANKMSDEELEAMLLEMQKLRTSPHPPILSYRYITELTTPTEDRFV